MISLYLFYSSLTVVWLANDLIKHYFPYLKMLGHTSYNVLVCTLIRAYCPNCGCFLDLHTGLTYTVQS